MNTPLCPICNHNYIFNGTDMCRKCTKEAVGLRELSIIAQANHDIDIIMDLMSEKIIEINLKLDDVIIRKLCTEYFKNGKETSERLRESDNLYQQLDHANNMVIV